MKRKPTTPRSRVKNAIRQMWLRSRERAAAVKLHSNTCQHCGRKGSVAKGKEVKIQCHHTKGIDWDGVVDLIFERVLQTPLDYTVLCKECHDKEHERLKGGQNGPS
jgi:5-methylcytosine-specific restriction endonuclease McrA